MSTVINGIEIDNFTRGYLTCALWSSTDDDTPLGDKCGIEDIHVDFLKAAVATCKDFQEKNAKDLQAYYADTRIRPWSLEVTAQDYAGHDFWLTRNGHGVGFWDRGMGKVGDRLTESSKAYGGCDVYVCDDGKVHLS